MGKPAPAPVYMGSAQIAKAMHDILQTAARKSGNPLLSFGEFDPVFGTFEITVNLPGCEGEAFRCEINRLRMVPDRG